MQAPFPLLLRPAEPSDIDTLVDIACAAFASSIGQTKEFAGQGGAVKGALVDAMPLVLENATVAQVDGQLAGFTALKGDTGQVGDVWVRPEHQNRGIGAMLLAASEARVRATGLHCSWLKTHADNTRALRFYNIHGYSLLSVEIASWGPRPEVRYPKALLGKQLVRPDAAKADTMTDVRRGIDTLDPMLVALLAERFTFIDRAAELKPAITMPARVTSRVEEVVNNARQQAVSIGFDPDLTETLWRQMVDLAIDREERAFEAASPGAKETGTG